VVRKQHTESGKMQGTRLNHMGIFLILFFDMFLIFSAFILTHESRNNHK